MSDPSRTGMIAPVTQRYAEMVVVVLVDSLIFFDSLSIEKCRGNITFSAMPM